MIYLKHRTTMGNVCLVVFLAVFLAQLALLAEPVFAQPVTVPAAGGTIQWGDALLPELDLPPLGGVWVDTARIAIYRADEPDDEPTEPGAFELIGQVVRVVYNRFLNVFAAIVPGVISAPEAMQLRWLIAVLPRVYDTVYLDVYLRPPMPPPFVPPVTPPVVPPVPPVPPAPPVPPRPPVIIRPPRPGAPPLVTVPIPTGLASLEPDAGTATAYPFFDVFESLALDPARPSILVGDLTPVEAPVHRFETLLTMMAEAYDQVTEYRGNVNAVFPAGAVDLLALAERHPDAALVFSAAVTTGAPAAAVVDAVLPPGDARVLASPVYDLQLYVAINGDVVERITEFEREVTFAFRFNPGVDPDALALYQIRPDGTLVFHHNQTVDPLAGTLLLRRAGTSRYVVLENTREFVDVPQTHWAYRPVKQLMTREVVRGMTETTFEPATVVTRAQFVTFVQRALGIPSFTPATPTFRDVRPGDWFYGSVEAAVRAGLARGMGDGTFDPHARVTREQMAAFIARAMAVGGRPMALTPEERAAVLATFVDPGAISGWAREDMAIAAGRGIIRGLPGQLLAPAAHGDRAQAATMVQRLLMHLGLIMW